MEYCPRCMRPAMSQICPHCGSSIHGQNKRWMLPVGTRLTGNSGTYQLGMALGMGGFGITYIALELETGHRVAVKEFFPYRSSLAQRGADGITVMPMSGRDNDYNRGRISFLKEARVLASMKDSHPAVMRGLDYVETHNTAYLVMEYLDGSPLYQVVQKRGQISPEELLPKIDRLMDGVIWLHGRGIIHRDICPDNIMWMTDGSLKLMDFGAARMTAGNSEFSVQFKPHYAPVEQYTSSGQGPWTDVYTLAATICFCLTGQNPVASPERLLRREEDGVDPLRLPDNLESAQRAALQHALGVRKEERPETMEQFRRELFPPPPVPLPIPTDTWIREHLIAVVSAVLLAITLIFAIILLTSRAMAADIASDGGAWASAEGAGTQSISVMFYS